MTAHKIMVVDDNAATRRMVRTALTRHGHEVIEAPDGATARYLMTHERPDVVLQDLTLPDTDGFTLVGELRTLATGTVAILAFSGFVSKLDEARASAVGFDDIITKPITAARLVPLIEAHLVMPAPGADAFGRGHRLVLADDDPLQLKLAAFRLGRLGFEVETVVDGEQALVAIRRAPPAAVISDVLMPRLDGFGLAIALQQDPALRAVPLLLITSSYVDPSDRELARRAGASELVLRTPDLAELVGSLRSTIADRRSAPRATPDPFPDLDQERHRRVARQLERQVLLNSGLAKRCSALASELTVLAGISETVLRHRDVEVALDEALAQCFDAGGISIGALYLLEADGSLRARAIGGDAAWSPDDLRALAGPTPFFGREAVLHALMATGQPRYLSATAPPPPELAMLLERCRAAAIFLVPLVRLGTPLGVLMMGSQRRELDDDDLQAFAVGVGNQISQVLSLARAYAAREAAEQLATAQAAVLAAVVDNAPDFVLHIDLDGTIRFANRTLPPNDPARIVGTNWSSYVPADQQRVVRDALATMLATGAPVGYETVGHGADRQPAWYAVRLGPIRERDRITGAVLIARDVSERKHAEMHLMVADRMASIGTLAAGVAHEINNPLASVIANLDMALADVLELGERERERFALPAELVDELRDARTAAERVRQIVRDLKMFSRAEEDSRGPVDVEHVLDSTLRMAWNELRHRARVIKRYGKVKPVDANESRLGQVFLNLILNAVHALPDGNYAGNEIVITTELDAGGRVVIAVADTGVGIAPEIRQRLFTPFFTTKPVGVGTGLGLAISHRIVTSLGGTLGFDSELGKGTTFRVTLPAARGTTAPLPVRAPSGTIAVKRGRVLVIDDELTIAQTLRRSLATAHDVTMYTRARDALDLLASGAQFDVILCDLTMPEVTGMALYLELRARDPAQADKVVFVTGGAFSIAAREFLDTVPNRRLEKPFDLRTLRELVAELLESA